LKTLILIFMHQHRLTTCTAGFRYLSTIE